MRGKIGKRRGEEKNFHTLRRNQFDYFIQIKYPTRFSLLSPTFSLSSDSDFLFSPFSCTDAEHSIFSMEKIGHFSPLPSFWSRDPIVNASKYLKFKSILHTFTIYIFLSPENPSFSLEWIFIYNSFINFMNFGEMRNSLGASDPTKYGKRKY